MGTIIGVIFLFIPLAICCFLIGMGFKQLRAKMQVEGIPTVKISTGAIGTNVEIKGMILTPKDNLIIGTVSEKPCAFYQITIEKMGSES